MAYKAVFTSDAQKQLAKLDKPVARRILAYFTELEALDDPRLRGKGLVGDRAGLWRYRIGDYRVICELNDAALIILALEVGHRRSVYDS